jgi:hypothetical protein
MSPGLCLDSGEFIPAAELNQRIDMTKPAKYPMLSDPYAAMTAMQKRISFLEGMVHTCSTGCTKAGCVNQVLQKRIAELEAQLASGQAAVARAGNPDLLKALDSLLDYQVQPIASGQGPMTELQALCAYERSCPGGLNKTPGNVAALMRLVREIEYEQGIKEKP